MIVAWRLERLKPVRKLEGNRFIIEFDCEEEFNYVINGGPWKHKGDALIVVPYDGITRPSEVGIDSVNLWVRFMDVPVLLMNEMFTGVLARKVSKKVLEIGRPGGNYLRARIAFPLEEAIKPTVEAAVKGYGRMSFEVKYENAPFFCFNCGRMGHAKKECPEEEMEDEEEEGGLAGGEDMRRRKKYGEWLRKTPPKRGEDRQLIFPSAPTKANRALNFSGDQLLRIQAASSATGGGGGKKEFVEKQNQKLMLEFPSIASPKKLPHAVSNALSDGMSKMGMEAEKMANNESSRLNRVSGLNSYAGSSDGTGASVGDGKPAEYRTIHERLQAAKQAAKGKAVVDKKLLKGPSPVKEIGKAKRSKITGKAATAQHLQSFVEHDERAGVITTHVGGGIGAGGTTTPAEEMGMVDSLTREDGAEATNAEPGKLNLTGTREGSRQEQ
ncbi:unnamed protein product [Urochloa humidicola]